MAKSELTLTSKTNMFGTTVTLSNADGSYSSVIAENIPFDPLAANSTSVEHGWRFRNPHTSDADWKSMLNSLKDADGGYNITAVLETDDDRPDDEYRQKVIAKVLLENEDDAAVFAWTNVSSWQKWGDAEEKDELEDIEARAKNKGVLNEDGTITATVTVSELGDHI